MKYEIVVPMRVRDYEFEAPMVDVAGGMTVCPATGRYRGNDARIHDEFVDWLMFLIQREDEVQFGLLLDDYVEKLLETQEKVLIGIDGEYALVSKRGVEEIR